MGQLHRWDGQAVTLLNSAGESDAMPLDQVLRIDLNYNNSRTVASPNMQVHLIDQSHVGVTQYFTQGDQALLSEPSNFTASQQPFSISLDAVQAVRLLPLGPNSANVAKQWNDIRNLDPTGDLIVIRPPGTTTLNYVEGTLGDVTPEAVQFNLEGEDIQVNRNKVFGLIYFRNPNDHSQPAARVEGPNLRLSATAVSGDGQTLAIKTQHFGLLNLPTARLFSIDYSSDRLQYLSDLESMENKWTPPPGGASLPSLLGSFARDRGLYNDQLLLEYPAESLPADLASSAGINARIAFTKGLAIRSRSQVSYRIPTGFSNFRATAGIDPRSSATGEVELTLLADGKELLKQVIRGGNEPVEVDCDIEGNREFTIVVDYGTPAAIGAGAGDNLHLAEARFTK